MDACKQGSEKTIYALVTDLGVSTDTPPPPSSSSRQPLMENNSAAAVVSRYFNKTEHVSSHMLINRSVQTRINTYDEVISVQPPVLGGLLLMEPPAVFVSGRDWTGSDWDSIPQIDRWWSPAARSFHTRIPS